MVLPRLLYGQSNSFSYTLRNESDLFSAFNYTIWRGYPMVKVKRKYGTISLAVLVLIVAILSGCGKSNETGPASGSSTPGGVVSSEQPKAETKDDENVELVFWTYPVLDLPGQKPGEYNNVLIEKFQNKYPNVKIKLEIIPYEGGDQKVNVALASNTAPDIFNDYPGRTTGYAQRGYTVPLNDMFTDEQLKQIPEDLLRMVSLSDGTIFSYPTGLGATMLVINKTLVEAAGASEFLPKGEMRTWTTEQFEQLLKAVKDYQKNDSYPMTLFALNEQGDMLYHSFMAGFGGKKFSDDRVTSVMNSAENVQALEWVKSLVEKGLVFPNPETRPASMSNDYFVQGKTAVALGSLNTFNLVKKAKEDGTIPEEFEMMLAPFPSSKEDHGVIVPGGGVFVLFNNGDEKKIEYAKKFVDFAVNEDPDFFKAAKTFDVFGKHMMVDELSPEQLYMSKAISETEKISRIDLSYDVDGYTQTRAVFFPEMQAIFIGAKTPQQAMDDFVKKSNEIVKAASASKK